MRNPNITWSSTVPLADIKIAKPIYCNDYINSMKRYGRGRTARRVAGQMNKMEAKYAEVLEARLRLGEVLFYKYEGAKLRLAVNTTYSPDFLVQLANGEIEFHETKGFWEQASRIKIKVAADMFPFRFVAVTHKKGEWQFEEF